MSDFARVAANLRWALGAERFVALGTGSVAELAAAEPETPIACADSAAALEGLADLPVERREWDSGSAAPPFAAGELERALIVCDGLLERVADPAALIGTIGELLSGASAALLAVQDRDLTGRAKGDPDPPPSHAWSAAELAALLAEHGHPPAWLGLTDGRGEVGRRSEVACALAGTAGERVGEALAAGGLGLRFDRAAPPADADTGTRARVCIASYELVGPTRSGGIGTAYTSLAEALAAAGHEVTLLFTGWPDPGGPPFEHWVAHYRERGIELAQLPPGLEAEAETGHPQARRSYAAYRWLREREREQPFDVIHFPETVGHGYYTALARHQSLAFERTTIVIGTHSSTSWVLETNGHLCQSAHDFADDFIERETVRLADALVSPSAYMLDWMRARGWTLPRRSFVQQYVRSRAVSPALEPASAATGRAGEAAGRAPAAASRAGGAGDGGEGDDGEADDGTELVFFGRLETRKGLELFCDALDRLAEADDVRPARVTFLGKQAPVGGRPAGELIAARAPAWPWPARVVDDLGQPEAIAYLRAPGRRLAVMPSLADNSPNTVYEALALEIPFIVSRVGGTAELIDPRNVARASFDPGAAGDGAAELAERLRAAITAERLEPPRPAVDPQRNRAAHLRWHEALAAGPPPPPAPADPPAVAVAITESGGDPAPTHDSLAAQTRAPASVVAAESVGDGTGIEAGLLAFVPAGVRLAPEALATLAAVGARTEAAIVAAAIAVPGERPHLRVPVGGPPAAALLYRCLGDAVWAIRASVLAELGGLRDNVPVADRGHELLLRAALAGHRIEPLAEPLASAPPKLLPQLELAVPWRSSPWLARAIGAAATGAGRGSPGRGGAGAEPAAPGSADPARLAELAQQLWAIAGARERDLMVLYENRFGRLTRPLRWIRARARRASAAARRIGSV